MTRGLVLASTETSFSRVLGANDTIRLGAIGLGGRRLIRIIATADVSAPAPNLAWGDRPMVVANLVTQCGDYRRLRENKDVDAVVVGTPDHWQVAMTRAAVNDGIDVPARCRSRMGGMRGVLVKASKQIGQAGYQQRRPRPAVSRFKAYTSGLRRPNYIERRGRGRHRSVTLR